MCVGVYARTCVCGAHSSTCSGQGTDRKCGGHHSKSHGESAGLAGVGGRRKTSLSPGLKFEQGLLGRPGQGRALWEGQGGAG